MRTKGSSSGSLQTVTLKPPLEHTEVAESKSQAVSNSLLQVVFISSMEGTPSLEVAHFQDSSFITSRTLQKLNLLTASV